MPMNTPEAAVHFPTTPSPIGTLSTPASRAARSPTPVQPNSGHTSTRDARQALATGLVLKNGVLHHRYDQMRAPWPMNYERSHLEFEGLDLTFSTMVGHPITFIPVDGKEDCRVLDLGCGTGLWVIQAAQEWPEATFVGLDLVDIQHPHSYMDKSIQSRIKWVHSNFLTHRLPFEDDEFDVVRMHYLAKGIPETKWGSLFQEVNRVLRPGGAVDLLDEDIIFPSIPRWFTDALHPEDLLNEAGRPGYSTPTAVNTSRAKGSMHRHALLESLFKFVFSTRFISLEPTSVIAVYFTTQFVKTRLPPARDFPVPPIRLPVLPTEELSDLAVSVTPDVVDEWDLLAFGTPWHNMTSTPSTSTSTFVEIASGIMSDDPSESDAASMDVWSRFYGHESTSILEDYPTPLIKRSMDMHLHRAFQSVLACREAMWDELQSRLHNHLRVFWRLGWKLDEKDSANLTIARRHFDQLFARYESDMRARLSLDQRLSDLGWAGSAIWSNPVDVSSKREMHARLSAALAAGPPTDPDNDVCRRLRLIFGRKDS